MTQHVAHRTSDEIHKLRAEVELLTALLKECQPYIANTKNWDAKLIFRVEAALAAEDPKP